MRYRYIVCLILIVFSVPLFADSGVGTVGNGITALKRPEINQVPPPHSSRLKFRVPGPVCMCNGGLTEAQISAAEHARELARITGQKKHKK